MNRPRTHSALFVVAFAVTLLLACNLGGLVPFSSGVRGSGNVIEEERAVSGVTSVSLGTLGNLAIELGDTESFRIEAEDNLMEFFEAEVRDGQLRIATRPGVQLDPTLPVRYYLTAKQISGISISSSGDVQAPDISTDRFEANLSSSGDLQLGNLDVQSLSVNLSSSGDVVMDQLRAESLKVNLSSAGDLTIAGGRVDRQVITLSSAGDYMAENLESGQASVSINSSGGATIWVEDDLQANLNSSGNLRYRGNPTVNASTNSSGAVIPIDG